MVKVGITASAGSSGWLEYILLRRFLQRRIGPVTFPLMLQLSLWSSAIVAAATAITFDLFLARRIAQHLPLQHIAEAVLVAGVFGIAYFAAAIASWVPEAKATLGLLNSR